MSDNEEKRRPNANYKLSKENVLPEEVTYHYNREQRLANASRSIQKLYEDQQTQFPGLLRPIVRMAKKPRTMTFFSILMCCVLMLIASYAKSLAKTNELDGNQLTVQAVKYDGIVIMVLHKQAGNRGFARNHPVYAGAVDITVLPSGRAPGQTQSAEALYTHKIFFTRERQEQYSFVLPFDADELVIVFQTENKTLNITIQPE